jgi:hypothetical protein
MSDSRPYLVVQAHIDPAVLDEFDRWVREVHFNTALRIPGVVSGRRCYTARGRPNYFTVFKLKDETVIRSALSSEEAALARAQWNRWLPYVEDGSLQVAVFASIVGSLALFQNN